jgi:arylformamidase
MAKYPSLGDFHRTVLKDYSIGSDMALCEIGLVVHLGTHIDAPYHFCKDGSRLDELDPGIFLGSAQVIEVPKDRDRIDRQFLESVRVSSPRVLFKTRNSSPQADADATAGNVYFAADGASYLVERSVLLVGIDGFSVDAYGAKDKSAHLAFLSHEVAILEGIVLGDVEEGEYFLSCLPLRIAEAEAAPCRAVLATPLSEVGK